MSAPTKDSFAGVRAHVIGLGAYGTGRAVARALWRRGAKVTVSDIKTAAEVRAEIEGLRDADVLIQTGKEAYRGIEEAEVVVVSPGVPLDIPPLVRARARGARVISDIELAFLIAPCPMIAVTGTKGKTTTTTLIGELLNDSGKSALVGGNIGRPLVELAEEAAATDTLVAEVSSFQLEATEQFRPQVAVLLNVLPDHLDRHVTMAAYQEAKARIFANQQAEDFAIINRDEPAAWALRERTRAQVIPFSVKQAEPAGADIAGGWLKVQGERIAPVEAVQLRGRHNLGNALAALAAAKLAGASLDRAEATLRRFRGVEHRLEIVGTVGGVVFVNDSQATTPAATIAALEAFEERVTLVAGGRAKVHDFSALGEALAERGAALVVIGEAAEEIGEAARAAGVTSISTAASLPEAVRVAFGRAKPGEVVLLSPACASFDMFQNMAERGHIFKAAVEQLAAEEREKQSCQR